MHGRLGVLALRSSPADIGWLWLQQHSLQFLWDSGEIFACKDCNYGSSFAGAAWQPSPPILSLWECVLPPFQAIIPTVYQYTSHASSVVKVVKWTRGRRFQGLTHFYNSYETTFRLWAEFPSKNRAQVSVLEPSHSSHLTSNGHFHQCTHLVTFRSD